MKENISYARKKLKVTDACQKSTYDAVVVGSGPNGLACAITLFQAGNSVLLVEAQTIPGGGCRTMELTIPGFKHDICSAVHPLGFGSPFFRTLPLAQYGLQWINPDSAYVHAYSAEKALVVSRSLEETANNLGQAGASFCRMMSSMSPNWGDVCDVLLQPLKAVNYPLPLAIFGWRALMSAQRLSDKYLTERESRAIFAGVAAHASVRLDSPASASIGLVLAIAAHAVGWPLPEGGAQSLTQSLMRYFFALGGEAVMESRVSSLHDLPACRFLFLDLTPLQFLNIAPDVLPDSYRRQLLSYRYGPSCFKMDWALSGAIPWNAAEFFKAPTVHLGGSYEDIAQSERLVWDGQHAPAPYVLLTQPTLFDGSRSPEGTHIVWAYCHTPYGSEQDRTNDIESQIERYAPGFRKKILARSVLTPSRLEEQNENHVGGDINGGTLSLAQLFARPVASRIPYTTPLPNVYLCSSSTPPGGGVHGMCGYYAAWTALKFGKKGLVAISKQMRRPTAKIRQS